MTTTQAAALRQKWNQRTNQDCEHKMLELETSEQGYLTGNYNCVFCGAAVVQKPTGGGKAW